MFALVASGVMSGLVGLAVFMRRPPSPDVTETFAGTVIGHRGCRHVEGIPENTVEACRYAVSERGAHGVEVDVHLTSDGVLVVFHDSSVRGRPIASMTYAEVCDALKPMTPPTLRQIVEYTRSMDCLVLIEVKTSWRDVGEVTRRVASLWTEDPSDYMRRKAMLIAFHPLVILYAKDQDRRIPVCWLSFLPTLITRMFAWWLRPSAVGLPASKANQAASVRTSIPLTYLWGVSTPLDPIVAQPRSFVSVSNPDRHSGP